MNSRRLIKPSLTTARVGLSISLALLLIVATGCGPVSNRSQSPFAGGLLNRGNDLASNNTPTGFGGGFGQSVFGDRTGSGQSGQLFGPSGGFNSGSGNRGAGNIALQQPQFPQPNAQFQQPNFNQQAFAAQSQNQNQLASQVNSLNQRVTAFDADNQLLNTELASLKQKLQLSENYGQTLKQQLAESSSQIQQFDRERQGSAQQIAAAQLQLQQLQQQNQQVQQQLAQAQQAADANTGARFANAGFAGGASASLPAAASLRANNSLVQRLNQINIPGGQARLDGDVIRIEFPSDTLFVPGTYQLQPAQLPVLQGIAGAIRRDFPKQIVGIEAHWDGTPLNPSTTSHHQLTATQSLAIFDRLVSLGVPRNQLFTMALGSNRPRHSQTMANGISPNRRIELVIYPETFDGT